MRPLLVTILFGTLGELLLNASLFGSLAITYIFKLSALVFSALFLGSLFLAILFLIIECGYGIHRNYGWAVALRRLRNARKKSNDMASGIK
jgi:hypothetical protein